MKTYNLATQYLMKTPQPAVLKSYINDSATYLRDRLKASSAYNVYVLFVVIIILKLCYFLCLT